MFPTRTAAVGAAIIAGLSAQAGLVGTTEMFNSGSSGWLDAGNAPLSWSAAGSFDGSGYVSTSASFAGNVLLDPVVLFRGQTGASGDAFDGNYLAEGVTGISFQVSHNASVPVHMFVRYSLPAFFPGVIIERFIDINAGSWQEVLIPIADNPPDFVLTEEAAGTFPAVMSDVGNLQIGVTVSDDLAGLAGPFTFNLDQVTLVPAPGVGTALALTGALGLTRRRRA
ncbi:MAG: hypothetical protein ACYTF7_04610 [Planctomycetota bacterium]|jgi:hypothetical protein